MSVPLAALSKLRKVREEVVVAIHHVDHESLHFLNVEERLAAPRPLGERSPLHSEAEPYD
jgi:hypothetical protein